MSWAYSPVPGTVPYRVIRALEGRRGQPPISTPDLVTALQLEIDAPLVTYMKAAVRGGAVKTTYGTSPITKRRVLMWELGDGTPLPAPPDDDDDADAAPPPPPAPTGAWLPGRWVFDLANGASGEVEKPEAAPAAQVDPVGSEELADALAASDTCLPQEAAPVACSCAAPVEQNRAAGPVEMFRADVEPEEPFVCALWSDGRLQLQRGDAELALLTVDETRELVAYLERMACAEA